MSLLSAHFEQIAISCEGIDSLPYVYFFSFPFSHSNKVLTRTMTNQRNHTSPRFPPPKIFTNALLANHDITSLIRDTEAHERALFSVPPPLPPASAPPEPASSSKAASSSSRRQTVFNVASGEVTTAPGSGTGGVRGSGGGGGAPRRHTAVAAVLGGDLHEQIRRSERRRGAGDEVDLELLLRSAEKLCGVYPLPGAPERIPALRTKHAHSRDTLAYYEAKVAEQAEALGRMNRDHWMDEEEDDVVEDDDDDVDGVGDVTEEDLVTEEEEVRDLERKKRELQDRLRAMEKDLGGLMNM